MNGKDSSDSKTGSGWMPIYVYIKYFTYDCKY